VPDICRFLGIVIKMFVDDHNPPHFHAFYGEHQALTRSTGFPVFVAACRRVFVDLLIEWAPCIRKSCSKIGDSPSGVIRS